jgi:hypothetical protein
LVIDIHNALELEKENIMYSVRGKLS